MSTPLEGVRVLDLSRVFAGPVAGRMLADLGADVVKVEPPEGDVTRTFGRGPQTPYFRQQNAGKRAITVDLTTTEGRELVRRLAGRGTESPEVVEQRLSLAREELAAEGEFDLTLVNTDVEEIASRLVALAVASGD